MKGKKRKRTADPFYIIVHEEALAGGEIQHLTREKLASEDEAIERFEEQCLEKENYILCLVKPWKRLTLGGAKVEDLDDGN